jgi:Ca-activated chloride channel family protein
LALLPELAAEVMPLAGERPEAALAQLAALRARLGAPPVNTLWLTRTPARVAALPVAAGERRFLIDLAAPASADGSATALAALREAPVRWRLEALPAAAGLPAAGALLTLALLPLALLGLRRALLPAVLVAALLSPPADAAGDDPRWQAVADYRAGRYAEVVGALARLDDPVSHYNRGNALARLGRLAEAEAAYQASLAGRPGNPDALHNLELVRRLQAPAGGKPPPAAAMPEPAPAEAARLAAQWLRGVPDEPGGLLRAKLRLEHQRRLAAGDAR